MATEVIQSVPGNLKTQIYGFDGTTTRVVLINSDGNLTTTNIRKFTETIQGVTTVDTYVGGTSQDVSRQGEYSFFISNFGANSATIKVQISPNNSAWVDDGGEIILPSNRAIVVTSNYFLRYIRIAYKSTTAGQATSLNIFYQART